MTTSNCKICILSSSHKWDDIRIYQKEAKSLFKYGYDVNIVTFEAPELSIDGVKFISCGKRNTNRFKRFLFGPYKIFIEAKKTNADIYHFHDPELLIYGLFLKWSGKKVIYDSHEDLPRQIIGRDWINKNLKKTISKTLEFIENFASKRFDCVITATPYINNRFININKNSVNINNYPILNELSTQTKWEEKENEICYVGGIEKIRGIKELIESLEYFDVKLNLIGEFDPKNYIEEFTSKKVWEKVNYYGFLNRKEVAKILGKSKIGIITFLPEPNHINSQPNKMFEYMSAEIPVIASNFPLWKDIIEKNNCGICVDPKDSFQIANAINYLLLNNEEAKQMGINGKKAINEIYNWGNEEQKLFLIYQNLIKKVK